MMNNPMNMLMSMMSGNADPMQFLQQMAGSNPQVNQIMQIVNGKSPQELQTIATNMAKQYGMTPEEVIRKFQGK